MTIEQVIEEQKREFEEKFVYRDKGPDFDGYDAEPAVWGEEMEGLTDDEQIEKFEDWFASRQRELVKSVVEELKKVEKEKWSDAEHCTCLIYAIDLLEKQLLTNKTK